LVSSDTQTRENFLTKIGLNLPPAPAVKNLPHGFDMSSMFQRYLPYIRLLLLALFSINALFAAVRNSAVCDEIGAHIPCGYMYWTSGVFGGGINNPPLGQLLIALPVKVFGLSYDLYTEQHLLLFRLVVLLMAVLLGRLIYRFASDLFSPTVGIAALFLYAFSPNVLAHASLATLDFPVTFFIFLTIYFLYRYVERPGVVRMLALSMAMACAILIKIQALLLLVVTALCFAVFIKDILPKNKQKRYIVFGSWLLIPASIIVVTNIVYMNLPASAGELMPAQFMEAIKGKLFHVERGHFAYLLGNYSTEGWWYYFPVAIFFKTPLPVLLLLAAGILRRPSRKTAIYIIVPLVLLLAVAMRGRINIGLRHILTIYPFIFIIAAYPLSKLWNTAVGKITLLVVVGWYVAQALFITPHHLSYFNVIAGGPKNGHRYLIDSNFDWGQNDNYLRSYVESKNIDYQINPDPFTPSNGHILVNANAFYGVMNQGDKAYSWLKDYEPAIQIAFTWFEFEIPQGTFADPPDYEEWRQLFISYVIDMQNRYPAIENIQYHIELARLCISLRAYDLAFSELRSLLLRQPDCMPAFVLGGELIVRYKLGVQLFKGTEYLYGNQSQKKPGVTLDDDYVASMAKRAGVGNQISVLYNWIGMERFQSRDINNAVEAFKTALMFNPDNSDAKASLARIEQAREPR
jgi:tetratricopeptide (TPR) repeat protein